jgi:hypothetical protein
MILMQWAAKGASMERLRLAFLLVRPSWRPVLLWTAIAGFRPALDALYEKPTQSDFVPKVSIEWYLIVALLIVLAIALVIAANRLHNSPVAFQKNADEMERWREKGITLTWEWQVPAQYPNAQTEAADWRTDIVERIRRKYGDRAAGTFNNLDIIAYQAIGASRATPYISHILRTANLNRVIDQVLHGEFRPRNGNPF